MLTRIHIFQYYLQNTETELCIRLFLFVSIETDLQNVSFEKEYNISILNVKFPWINLILHGFKTIENRTSKLSYKNKIYALYCPHLSDWKMAINHKGVESDLQNLGLHPQDIKNYSGKILGLVELEPATQSHQSSNYWMHSYNYHYNIKHKFAAPESEYIIWKGSQGIKPVKFSSQQYQLMLPWCDKLYRPQQTSQLSSQNNQLAPETQIDSQNNQNANVETA